MGTGPKKVREYFKLARKEKPCILFIDELETIGCQRGQSYHNYSQNTERNATLTQLLGEMDGIESNSQILVIAATNREDLLDPALIRPGRFDYKIHLDIPTLEERKNLFKLYIRNNDYFVNSKELSEDSEFINDLANKSQGLTGAIIEDVINKTVSNICSRDGDVFEKDIIYDVLKQSKLEYLKFKVYEERNKMSS